MTSWAVLEWCREGGHALPLAGLLLQARSFLEVEVGFLSKFRVLYCPSQPSSRTFSLPMFRGGAIARRLWQDRQWPWSVAMG